MWKADFDNDEHDSNGESEVMESADFGNFAKDFSQRVKYTRCNKPQDQVIDLFNDNKFIFFVKREILLLKRLTNV